MSRAAADRQRDVSGVDEERALEALRLAWGDAWDIGRPGTGWRAERRDGTGHALTRASAAGLSLALRIGGRR